MIAVGVPGLPSLVCASDEADGVAAAVSENANLVMEQPPADRPDAEANIHVSSSNKSREKLESWTGGWALQDPLELAQHRLLDCVTQLKCVLYGLCVLRGHLRGTDQTDMPAAQRELRDR